MISNAVSLAAAALFVANGSIAVPAALGLDGSGAGVERSLLAAFLLNIALLLFAWRKSAELRDTNAARARVEREAYSLAYLDHTTGLFNRRHIAEELDRICATADPRVALLLLDLDHFKRVNDFYGHSAGDALLMSAADVIRRNVPAGACCGRLGGDEFGIVIRGDDSRPESVCAIAQRLLNELNKPIPIGPTLANISASVGISVLDQTCERAEWLLRRSDIAMYEAKRLGRNCFVWFDCEMEVELNKRNAVEADMRAALGRNEFVPYFQPLVDLDSGELKGFEVLARWNHPARGLLEPADFIAIAEATGLISPLSLSVMRQALIEARGWPSHLSIAINVSPVQFKDPMLAQRIVKMLAETGFPAGRLELEITESTLLEDHGLALATVESLKNHGIRISLDDFGTGYASLTQLRSLPFDRIKIDRSFVATVMEDEQSYAIVSAIANLGKNLRLPVTAEGVESACVHGKLQQLGCSDAQGWLFGRPVTAEQARELLGQSEEQDVAERHAEESPAPATKERRDHGRRGSSAA